MSCSHPIVIHGRVCSCGKCINCRKKRINSWAVRLHLEAKSYKGKSCYVTLTYNNSNLPVDGLLDKRDYQLFLKRLRKNLDKFGYGKIRYFMCGEYGDQFGRPHFHFIIFGISPLLRSVIEKTWNKGFVCVKPLDFKSCRYVAKYCVKQFAKEKCNRLTGEVISEFVSMSRRVGIGYCWLEDNFLDMVTRNYIRVGGFKYAIPKSFMEKLRKRGIKVLTHDVTILYNDRHYSYEDAFSRIGSAADFLRIDSNDIRKLNFVSFSDYIKQLESVSQSELNFCKLRNIDFYKFYRSNVSIADYMFDYFDFLYF